MQTSNDEEQEKCKTSIALFAVLSENFKLQHNETILSVQYCKLIRQQSENAQEWADPLRIKMHECKY